MIATARTLYAEYVSIADIKATFVLALVNPETGQTLDIVDRITFRPFNSVVVVLGGEFQVPADPVQHQGDHGIFDWAIARYQEGYNVSMYDEDDCSGYGQGAAYDNLVNSINNHLTENVVIIGYSHGGGSAYGLSWRLSENSAGRIGDITQNFNLALTGYIDAVADYSMNEEVRRPLLSMYHVNFYQRNSFLKGDETDAAPAIGSTENHHLDALGTSGIGHSNIDDDPFVLDTLTRRLKYRISNSKR